MARFYIINQIIIYAHGKHKTMCASLCDSGYNKHHYIAQYRTLLYYKEPVAPLLISIILYIIIRRNISALQTHILLQL